MKASEIRDLPDEELIDRLENMKEELFNLRFQMATGQLDNPMRMKQVRHDIARILTVVQERNIEGELDAELARAEERSLEERRAAIARGEPVGRPEARADEDEGEDDEEALEPGEPDEERIDEDEDDEPDEAEEEEAK